MRLTVLPLKSSLWSSHFHACCEMLCCFPAQILSSAIVFPESRWPLCAWGCLSMLLAHPWADPDCPRCQDCLELCPVGLGSWVLGHLYACLSCFLPCSFCFLHSVLR